MNRDVYHCVLCLDDANHMHHIIPRSAGGPDLEINLVPLCIKCHERIHSEGSWKDWVNTLILRKGLVEELWEN